MLYKKRTEWEVMWQREKDSVRGLWEPQARTRERLPENKCSPQLAATWFIAIVMATIENEFRQNKNPLWNLAVYTGCPPHLRDPACVIHKHFDRQVSAECNLSVKADLQVQRLQYLHETREKISKNN
jgi:hypothetical protein